MAVFAYVLAFLATGMCVLFFFRVRSPTSLVLWSPKILGGSAAVFVAVMGTLGVALGLLFRAPLAIAAGVLGVLLSMRYVLRVVARHDGFEQAFGLDWQSQIAPQQQARMLKRRWVWQLPSHRDVRWDRDVPFWTIPGTDRDLLCDIWQPPEGVSPSGLAFIYFHGSAWHWMDKDFGTRPFFRHLAAQGHVVWIKANAEKYGIDPARVVVAGGSAGGHLALLAAYAPDHPELTPDDVREADTSVRAVVAYYPGTDMHAFYQHFDATFGSLVKGLESGDGSILFRILGAVTRRVMGSSSEKMKEQAFPFDQVKEGTGLFLWMMTNLLGGSPDEVPEVYELASPITHVGSASPPTLLLQGEHDSFQPANASRALHRKLVEAGAPSVYVEFPQTEHGFDLLLPRYAPAAQAALYDVDRFLALMVRHKRA
jgi:acetyl esterase/lipase